MTINDELRAMRERVEAATEGPWTWGAQGDGWGDCGPSLETVKRGPVYSDGSQGAVEEIIGSWGYDANGILIGDNDATFIAHARTDLPRLLDAVQRVIPIHFSRNGYCNECGGQHPCATFRAIAESLES